ncbi:hypothetical protein V494_06184, partial [Pseudogymnoascus sp. VKM F-4513 (FW-928)]
MPLSAQQKPSFSSPSPTSTSPADEAPTTPSLPKDYKQIVQSLIRRHDISLDTKIDLWKRFAEYEACVEEEGAVFTVGEIGEDVEMPVPWMERDEEEGRDGGEEAYGGDGDSGYGRDESNGVDGGERREGEGNEKDVVDLEAEGNMNDEGQVVEEEIAVKDDDENRGGNGSGSPGATAPNPGAAKTRIARIPNTSSGNQEPIISTLFDTNTTHHHASSPSNPPH